MENLEQTNSGKKIKIEAITETYFAISTFREKSVA